MPLSVTLTLAGGHTVSTKQKTCWLHFLAHYLNGMTFAMVMKQLNTLRLLLSEIYRLNVNSCWFWFFFFFLFHDCIQTKLWHWHAFRHLCTSLIQICMMRDTAELYILILVYATWPWFKSHGCRKGKTSVPIVSQSCQWILMEFGMLLRLVGLINLILISSRQSIFKGGIQLSKNFYVGLYSDFEMLNSLNWVWR